MFNLLRILDTCWCRLIVHLFRGGFLCCRSSFSMVLCVLTVLMLLSIILTCFFCVSILCFHEIWWISVFMCLDSGFIIRPARVEANLHKNGSWLEAPKHMVYSSFPVCFICWYLLWSCLSIRFFLSSVFYGFLTFKNPLVNPNVQKLPCSNKAILKLRGMIPTIPQSTFIMPRTHLNRVHKLVDDGPSQSSRRSPGILCVFPSQTGISFRLVGCMLAILVVLGSAKPQHVPFWRWKVFCFLEHICILPEFPCCRLLSQPFWSINLTYEALFSTPFPE